ncbi:uncharacterized protein LOC101698902 isoform X2 [Heterocephalus glaber]|uniref:Uncharacterized protein LOC101698902 isoform X2 n=1 Tax=Heterocephalus glaber TaxID=10181 RepID=A0AAX6RT21_HETGA|nr:uncharacterized protein LOC101698902 isoform X2 [Heterocephalus glaber]
MLVEQSASCVLSHPAWSYLSYLFSHRLRQPPSWGSPCARQGRHRDTGQRVDLTQLLERPVSTAFLPHLHVLFNPCLPTRSAPPSGSRQLAFSTMAVTLAGQAEGLRTEVTGRTHRSHCPRLLHSLLPSPPSWFGPKLPPLGNLRGTGLRIPCLAPQCPPAPNRQMRMEGPASQTGFTPVTCAHPLEMSGKHNGQVFCLQSFRLNLFKFFIVWDWDTQECLHSHGDAQRTFPRERLDPEILDRASP